MRMNRPPRNSARPWIALVCCLSWLWAAGCSDSASPVNPDGPEILQGTVEYQGSSEHDVVMPDDGLFDLRLVDVRLVLVDISQVSPADLVFGFGLGQRDAAGTCALTTNFVLTEGDKSIFGLSGGNYCVRVFDPGVFPEDALLGYTLELEISV